MAEQRADGSWEHTPEPPEPEAFRDCVPVEVKPPPSPGSAPDRASTRCVCAPECCAWNCCPNPDCRSGRAVIPVTGGACQVASGKRPAPMTGPAPDLPAAEQRLCSSLGGADMDDFVEVITADLRAVLAELDRQRVIVRAAEALVECVNEGHDLDDNSDHPLWNRLDALAAAVRALLEGEGR